MWSALSVPSGYVDVTRGLLALKSEYPALSAALSLPAERVGDALLVGTITGVDDDEDPMFLQGGPYITSKGMFRVKWSPFRLEKSLDGGATWATLTLPGGERNGSYSLCVCPYTDMMFVTGNSAALRSVDGGDTWEAMEDPGPARSVVVLGGVAVAHVEFPEGLKTSASAGASPWVAGTIPEGWYPSTSFIGGDSSTMYHGGAGILKSEDGGATWAAVDMTSFGELPGEDIVGIAATVGDWPEFYFATAKGLYWLAWRGITKVFTPGEGDGAIIGLQSAPQTGEILIATANCVVMFDPQTAKSRRMLVQLDELTRITRPVVMSYAAIQAMGVRLVCSRWVPGDNYVVGSGLAASPAGPDYFVVPANPSAVDPFKVLLKT